MMEPFPFSGGPEDASTAAPAPGARLLHADRFTADCGQWVVEQQPGGTVTIGGGRLVVDDVNGGTVWFRPRLPASVCIRYTATVSSRRRVSDLNCFWQATDPARPQDLLAPGHPRNGFFGTYDRLRCYYVGCGGNNNTTTRFRRYDGTGARPLRPEHDRRETDVLLRPDHAYRIELVADGSRVQYRRDGELIFAVNDPAPLPAGWFGFRAMNCRLEFAAFEVWDLAAASR